MRAITFTTLLTLFTAVQSAPSLLPKRMNECGQSTFTSESTNASTALADCQLLQTVLSQPAIASFGWDVGPESKELIAYGTCAFTARAVGGKTGTLGNEDVFDLLRDSIAKEARNKHLGVRGSMFCGAAEVEWRIQKRGV
jgi:hypothetical protein